MCNTLQHTQLGMCTMQGGEDEGDMCVRERHHDLAEILKSSLTNKDDI